MSAPFLARDLNRREVQSILGAALAESGGSYKRALDLLGVEAADYLRFMDFLRHHDLKPHGYRRDATARCGVADAAPASRLYDAV